MGLYYRKDLFNLSNCWLSPEGKVIVGDDEFDGTAFHENLGYCIIRDLQNFKSKEETTKWFFTYFGGGYASEWLEDLGYVKLHGFRVESIEAKWITLADRRLTFQQKQKIRNWCRANGRTWDDAVVVV